MLSPFAEKLPKILGKKKPRRRRGFSNCLSTCCSAACASNGAAELLVDVASLGRLTVEVCAGLTLFAGVAFATWCRLVRTFSRASRDTEEWLVDCEALSAFTAVQVRTSAVTKNATVADTEAEAFVGASKVEAVVKSAVFAFNSGNNICTDVVTEVEATAANAVLVACDNAVYSFCVTTEIY